MAMKDGDSSCEIRLVEFPDQQVRELNRVAVIFQSDGGASGQIWRPGVLNHRLSIQHNREPIAAHRDDESIPFAERLVGLFPWCCSGTNGRRLVRIGAIAPNFAGTNGPAPDVRLSRANTSQADSGVS